MSKSSKKGRLKIYLGMSAGVGKTYAMLKDAEADLAKGIDIVAGYIEPHGRKETEDLVSIFERIPHKKLQHQAIELNEFDLETSLKRNPHTILVDELAHSNPPGLLHEKRWLDIQTLLDTGINVYTTLNIQHLESIAELVSTMSGIIVHETVPDSVLKRADTIEVIDIPPEDLIERLKAGKIYKGEKIQLALSNFFKEGNLLALREILLRKAAEKIDSDVLKFREASAVKSSWGTSDRVIVAVGPNKFAKRLIQKSVRIASARKSNLVVVYVQTPHLGVLPPEDQQKLEDVLELARVLGAEVERRFGTDIVAEILKASVSLNASLIVVGKPIKTRLKDFIFGSLADDLIRRSGNIDVQLITGEEEDATNRPLIIRDSRPKILGIAYALLVVIISTFLGIIFNNYIELSTIAMLYILGSVVIARGSGRTESVIASIASILAFNYFFIEPKYSLSVQNPEYLSTFVVMIVVSLSISGLVTRIRFQNRLVAEREKRAMLLYNAGRSINNALTQIDILNAVHSAICKLSEINCGILVVEDHSLKTALLSNNQFEKQNEELAVAKYVLDKKKAAGHLTDTLPGARALYLPIQTDKAIYGVCGIECTDNLVERELIPTYEIILQQAALCLERLALEEETLKSNLKIETEAVRTMVLSSVSHDFRTPLTVIEGAAEQISISSENNSKSFELSILILEHSKRLSRMVNNALSLTRLEQDTLKLNLEWESIEELIGQVLDKLRDALSNRIITVKYDDDLPLVMIDAVLVDQLITNIVENSIFHAPSATELNIIVKASKSELSISIEDNGPGFKKNINENFGIRNDTLKHTGIGLGLRLCELIVKLHKGEFTFQNKKNGGTEAHIILPTSSQDMT